MNENYSQPELYYPRWITEQLQEAVNMFPVIILTGARQVGKSTLLLNEKPFRSWRFQSMDDYGTVAQASKQPESLWAGTDRVILDEVQRVPDLLFAVKQAVDHNPGRYRFVLSGSANLLLMKQVSESLAGRAIYFVLDPLTLGEIHSKTPTDLISKALAKDWPKENALAETPPDPIPFLLKGFMPALMRLESNQAWLRWWDGYVATYLERDMRQVSQIDSLLDFRRVMELLALRSAQLINQSELARDSQVSQPTIHRYLNVLETTHLFDRLPAFTSNHTTRLLKSPKAFWTDPGLAVYLAGYYQEEELKNARECGSFFEMMIYHHLRVLAQLMTPPGRLFFWKTFSGSEVDFILEHGRRILAIEVKMTNRPGYNDAAGLRAFLEANPQASGGLLLHCGKEIKRLAENILAIPWTMITG